MTNPFIKISYIIDAIFIVAGILFSMTIIGLIIGIPLILFGLTGLFITAFAEHLDNRNKQNENICTHCGKQLVQGQIYFCSKTHWKYGRGFFRAPFCNECAKKCNKCKKYFCIKHIEKHKCE